MDTVSIHTVYVAITDFPEFCLWLRRALKATYGMFSRGTAYWIVPRIFYVFRRKMDENFISGVK